MNLRQQAEADLKFLLEDKENGFGWEIELTDPSGKVGSFVGLSGDVSATIDPSTGGLIMGSSAHAAIRMSSLVAAGFGLPAGPVESTARPWLAKFADIEGKPRTYAVVFGLPDRTLGLVILSLSSVADS